VRHASTVFNLSQIPPLSNREECYNPPLAERMKRRLFNLAVWTSLPYLLSVAAPLSVSSAYIGYKVFIEDSGPFDGWINFHSIEVIDPAAPENNVEMGANASLGICIYDTPYSPAPGITVSSSPRLVTRHTIHAYAPDIALMILVFGWLGWGGLLVTAIARRPRRVGMQRGFAVSMPPALPTRDCPECSTPRPSST
jgi:hypothetical protein